MPWTPNDAERQTRGDKPPGSSPAEPSVPNLGGQPDVSPRSSSASSTRIANSDAVYPTAGCQHRLFFSQVEYCDNLIFRRRAALHNLGERLLDANRIIGQPDKITVIFGRKVTKH
jgi:hypothetical protein